MKDNRQVGCLYGKDVKLAVQETAKQTRQDNEEAYKLNATSYEEFIEKRTNGAEYDDSLNNDDIVFKSWTKRSNVSGRLTKISQAVQVSSTQAEEKG